MRGLSIGDVARKTGLATSALRYYEKAGLLPAPGRASKQRRYDPEILGRIKVVQTALAAGFTIAETRKFLSGFPLGTRPSARWQALAARKRAELDSLIARATAMKTLLDSEFQCGCRSFADCEAAFARNGC